MSASVSFKSEFQKSADVLSAVDHPRWYAVYTWARHEKSVARHLSERNIDHLLPVYETVHRWRNGRAKVCLPLFPGYIFVRVPRTLRSRVLEVSGVVQLLGAGNRPTPLADDEVELLNRLAALGSERVQPHPYLGPGKRIQIAAGPLQGLKGTVQRSKTGERFVVSVDMIERSVAIEVDARDLRAAA